MTKRANLWWGTHLAFECPGCGEGHLVQVLGDGEPRWTWNGNLERLTLSPSILVRWSGLRDGQAVKSVCHSFVRDGRIQFLGDCTHALAGQTVDLPEHREE